MPALSPPPNLSVNRPGRPLSPSSLSSASSVDLEHATPRPSTRPTQAATASAKTKRHPLSAATSTNAAAAGNEIEMDQLGGRNFHSHRRRRSSLMNDALPAPSSSRNRAGSVRHVAPPKSKIREEEGERGLDGSTAMEEDDDSDLDDLSGADLNDDEETGLTERERDKRSRRRLRNAQLDQRFVRGDRISLDEKREADQNVVRRLVINGGLILLWYLFSLSISLYNKWMFDDGKLNFPFPLFTTALHMLIQFSLACIVLHFLPHLRPENSGAHGHGHASDLGRSRHEAEPADKTPMTRFFYWTRIGPCGAATGLDIGLGNASLKFITLTFYTMCKSSALAFVLLFAFLFKLETPTWRLVAIIATMTFGVVMMVAGEVEFDLAGFLLVISAAFFSGFRWGLTQILLLRNPATSNPFSSIFYLAPIMCLTLFLIALPSEGLLDLFSGIRDLAATHGTLLAPMILLFPGTIAFAMTASEFALLQRTSVVTLSIAGIFKEVVTISAAALVYDDSLTPINFSGLVVTIGAICAYNWIKIRRMREEAQHEVHRDHMIQDGDGLVMAAAPGENSAGGSDSSDGEDGQGLITTSGPSGSVTR